MPNSLPSLLEQRIGHKKTTTAEPWCDLTCFNTTISGDSSRADGIISVQKHLQAELRKVEGKKNPPKVQRIFKCNNFLGRSLPQKF
jgi:hypothetical protein